MHISSGATAEREKSQNSVRDLCQLPCAMPQELTAELDGINAGSKKFAPERVGMIDQAVRRENSEYSSSQVVSFNCALNLGDESA